MNIQLLFYCKYKKSFVFLIIFFMTSSFILPFIFNPQTKAARISVQITWTKYWCQDSYDLDDNGEFYLQFKYYNDVWYLEKTSRVSISANPTNPATPSITYTLTEDFVLGGNLYIRLLEHDVGRDDLVIPSYIKNHGSGDSVNWNSFYISTSGFTSEICYYDSPAHDKIEVVFTNLG